MGRVKSREGDGERDGKRKKLLKRRNVKTVRARRGKEKKERERERLCEREIAVFTDTWVVMEI